MPTCFSLRGKVGILFIAPTVNGSSNSMLFSWRTVAVESPVCQFLVLGKPDLDDEVQHPIFMHAQFFKVNHGRSLGQHASEWQIVGLLRGINARHFSTPYCRAIERRPWVRPK